MTAEAVSEFLHTPLYSVGAGELGVQASELESKLRDVLDISQAWGAVTLIDEVSTRFDSWDAVLMWEGTG